MKQPLQQIDLKPLTHSGHSVTPLCQKAEHQQWGVPDIVRAVQAQMGRAPACMSAQWQPLVPSCSSMTPSGPSRCGALGTRQAPHPECMYVLSSLACVGRMVANSHVLKHPLRSSGQGQVLGAQWAAVPARGQGPARAAAHIQVSQNYNCKNVAEAQMSLQVAGLFRD